MFSPLGSKAAEQAQTKNEQEIARYVSTQKAIKEQVDANDKTAETEAGGYQSADADAAIAAYKDLVGKIERDVASMGPAER